MRRRAEVGPIGRHAATVFVGQVAVMAFGVTDTVVAGRHSDAALAALSVGSAVFITVFVGLMSILQALLPEWAELHGAKRHSDLGRSVRQAMYLAALLMAIGVLTLLHPGALLEWTGVPPAMQPEVRRYLAVSALALPPALLFRLFATLNQALGRPRAVTALQIGALVLKVPLSIWFGLGGAGIDAQGAAGCAAATVVVNTAMVGVALWLLRSQDLYRQHGIWHRLERPDIRRIGAFLRHGLPAGLAVTVEVTSFTLMALFIARLGTVAAASHQIAANLAAVLYMMPLSLGIATSARASYWRGAGQAASARLAAGTGLALAAGLAIGASAVVWALHPTIASLYTAQRAVADSAQALLLCVAAYHVVDAVQAVSFFVLRSYRITVAPLVVYGLMLWGMGLLGGYRLAYFGFGGIAPMHSPLAFWLASTTALALTAAVLGTMLLRVTTARTERPPAA